jgi:colicin import membrane protein
MTDRYPSAFLLSATMHGAVVAALLLLGFLFNQPEKDPPKIFELVAGEGSNYLATEAPALGTPGGIKLNLPAPPKPKPAEPAPAEFTPPQPAPAPKPVITKAPPPPKAQPSIAKQILTKLYNADRKAKREVAKERAAEQARITKEEFDRANRAQAATKAATAKLQKIDAEGIAKGVAGGSPANKDSGAGGRALTSTAGDARERFDSALLAALRRALEEEKPPGLSESLVASVQFRVEADGTLTNVRLSKPSGSTEFDNAVRAAIRRVSGTIRPPAGSKSEVVELDFRAKEQDGE